MERVAVLLQVRRGRKESEVVRVAESSCWVPELEEGGDIEYEEDRGDR